MSPIHFNPVQSNPIRVFPSLRRPAQAALITSVNPSSTRISPIPWHNRTRIARTFSIPLLPNAYLYTYTPPEPCPTQLRPPTTQPPSKPEPRSSDPESTPSAKPSWPPRRPQKYLTSTFTRSPAIIQHGPEWAVVCLPFIGHHFVGRRTASTPAAPATTCDDYFRLLFQTLIFRQDETTYPPSSDFFVETAAEDGSGAVIVVGVAEFESVLTRKSWSEAYVYKFSQFDERGRFKAWEIWGDVLNAWDAVRTEDMDIGTP